MHVSERLTELKAFDADRASFEEMVLIEDDALRVRTAFDRHAVPVPEWLTDVIRTLNVEIGRRKRDDLERRLKELRTADAADMSASERREARKAERERIERELAGTAAPAGTTV